MRFAFDEANHNNHETISFCILLCSHGTDENNRQVITFIIFQWTKYGMIFISIWFSKKMLKHGASRELEFYLLWLVLSLSLLLCLFSLAQPMHCFVFSHSNKIVSAYIMHVQSDKWLKLKGLTIINNRIIKPKKNISLNAKRNCIQYQLGM